jgi:hypothetical protein
MVDVSSVASDGDSPPGSVGVLLSARLVTILVSHASGTSTYSRSAACHRRERVLHRVLGVGGRAEQTVGEGGQPIPAGLETRHGGMVSLLSGSLAS